MRERHPMEGRWWVIHAAIFAPLVLLLVVAFTTWRAERRYAAVTERVIHDYAAIAAWQYARRANMLLHDAVMHGLGDVTAGPGHQRSPGSIPGPASRILQAIQSSKALSAGTRFAFTYDASTGTLETAGPADPESRAMLQRRLRELASGPSRNGEPHRLLVDTTSSAAHAIAVQIVAPPDAPVRGAYGIVADPAALLGRVVSGVETAALFPAVRGADQLAASDLSIRLTRSDRVLFAAGPPPGSTAATDTAGLQRGELHVTIDVPSPLAAMLLVGGAPRSQIPALALMIALAFTLAALALAQQRRSRELERLRERFVANVSHELRTPLAQISMFAETLMHQRERSESERRQFVSIIYAEARRLATLVESVLRFSRGGAQRQPLHAERVSLRAEVQSAVDAFAPLASAADARVRVEGDEFDVAVDRGALRQIVLNLLDNAVKHGGRGTAVNVSVSRAGDEARLIVDDSGPGIPGELANRIFDPFVRADRANVPGAGIGLAVVHDLVTAHGGHIGVESSPLGGARFVVALPVLASPRPQERAAEAAAGV